MPIPRRTRESAADATLPPPLYETFQSEIDKWGRCTVCGGPRGEFHTAWLEEFGLDGESH